MSDEQRVRTMAGWVGVELSKSRVRTPGKATYGLWRVRSCQPVVREWTDYVFTLAEIERGVRSAIGRGTPARPGTLAIWSDVTGSGLGDSAGVTTRWTSAYRGPRNLGETGEALLLDLVLPSTPRSRQRKANAAFQAEHLKARELGLRARHGAKLRRANPASGNDHRAAGSDQGSMGVQ